MKWTGKECEDLIAAIREFGRDWVKVTEKLASKNVKAVQHKAERLHQLFKRDPTLPGSDILPILNQITRRPRTTTKTPPNAHTQETEKG